MFLKYFSIYICFLFILVLPFAACKKDHGGIDVGNPGPGTSKPVPSTFVGISVKNTPIKTDEYYRMTIQSETSAIIYRIGTVTESQTSALTQNSLSSFSVSATFSSDGQNVAMLFSHNNETITDVALIIDEINTESTFSVSRSTCAFNCTSVEHCDSFLQIIAGVDADTVARVSECLPRGQCQFDCSLDLESTEECLAQANLAEADCTGSICIICPCKITIADKAAAQALLRTLDTTPTPVDVMYGIRVGCAASNTNLITFLEAFLCSLEINPSLATDPDIQNDINNLEGIDISDLGGSCAAI